MTSVGIVLLIVSLAILIFASYMVYNCATKSPVAEEYFTTYNHAWGYAGPENSKVCSPTCSAIVGPDPEKKELHTWQYHPQNTLVDSKYFQARSCMDSVAQNRMEPNIDGSVGKINGAPLRVNDLYGSTSTRVPSDISNSSAYVISHPATADPLEYQTPEWSWPAQGV